MELPKELVEKAATELNETPETRVAGLEALRRYYADHPDEKPFRTDDPFLLMFLRHAKFDVIKARARIANLQRWLRDCREELGDVSQLRGEMFRELYGQQFMGLLGPQRRTRDGALISLVIPRNMEPLTDPAIMLKYKLWTMLRLVDDPYVQVCGQVILESLKDYSLLHSIRFRQVPTAIMRRHFQFAQECMPIRVKGIWMVQPPKWIGALYAIAKPFMSRKMRSRCRVFSSDFVKLHELIDPRVLPAEFGGSYPDQGQEWFEAEVRKEAEEEAARTKKEEAEEGAKGAAVKESGDADQPPAAATNLVTAVVTGA